MESILYAWRGEILGTLAFLASWLIFSRLWRRPFWSTCIPGMVLGLANEVATEPLWTYHLQVYVWRHVSPFVIAGWGVIFTWVIVLSDGLYRHWFHSAPQNFRQSYGKVLLTDFVVGVPILLGNELFGLHILKVWQYNSVLHWDTLLPVIHYPLEGLFALVFFTLAVTNAIRYWKGNPAQ